MANSPNAAPTAEADKGMTIFLDVFRRADKNDDGFISWEEFVSYFADGVMGKEELQTLFDEIDSHNTNNIDTGELCTYFTHHLGEFKEIFSLLEDLNKKMTNVLYSTAKVYKESSRTDKFIKRFLMHEIQNQMVALERPLEAASDTLDTQAREERADIKPLEVSDVIKKPNTSGIVPGRVVRRAKRQVSAPAGQMGEGGSMMNTQMDRLANLLDRLERKVNLDGFRDEEIFDGPDDTMVLVQRQFPVKTDHVDSFQCQLRAYIDLTQSSKGCINLSVRFNQGSKVFDIYEIWTTEDKYTENGSSETNKTLVQATADMLESTTTARAVQFPTSWWKRDF